MTPEYQEYTHYESTIPSILFGVLLGGLAGAVTMLLLAPQSGQATRAQIKQKSIELRDRTTEIVDESIAQVRSNANRITVEGREKLEELKNQGKDLVTEQLEHVSEAALAGKKAIHSSVN